MGTIGKTEKKRKKIIALLSLFRLAKKKVLIMETAIIFFLFFAVPRYNPRRRRIRIHTYINITLIGTNPSGFITFSEKEIIGIWNFFALRGPRRTESHRISKQGANEDPRQKAFHPPR